MLEAIQHCKGKAFCLEAYCGDLHVAASHVALWCFHKLEYTVNKPQIAHN